MSKTATNLVKFHERVTPKWTSFLPLFLILPTFWLTLAPINVAVGIGSGIGVSLLALWFLLANSPLVEISDQELRVGKAKIQRKFIGTVQVIEFENQFSERGPNLDSRAYLAIQASAKGLIKVQIKDANDPTPYWLISSNRPQELVEALKG